jgi:hypothetical protein
MLARTPDLSSRVAAVANESEEARVDKYLRYHIQHIVNQEIILKKHFQAIILRLPQQLVDRLDSVTYDLRFPSRSEYLRFAIARQIDQAEREIRR